MILANGCNITKSEKTKGVWILSVPTVYIYIEQQKIKVVILTEIDTDAVYHV